MAANAIIGGTYTFEALFRDTDGAPLAVNVPAISLFYFDENGTKQVELNAVAMVGPTVPEVGRYVYAYTIPTTFAHGSSLQAEMTGTHPGSGDTLAVNMTLNLISAESQPTTGLTHRFF
jgi:hypothetical protein